MPTDDHVPVVHPPTEDELERSRVERALVARCFRSLEDELFRLVELIEGETWPSNSLMARARRISALGPALTIHMVTQLGRSTHAASILLDTKIPTTSAYALRASLENSGRALWMIDGDDRAVVCHALQQLAHEISRGAQSSKIEAFREDAPYWLVDLGRAAGLSVQLRERDGRVASILIDGAQRPSATDLIKSISPELARIHGSLSALVHGEAWRLVFPTVARTADGQLRETADDLFAEAVGGVMSSSLVALREVSTAFGLDSANRIERRNLEDEARSLRLSWPMLLGRRRPSQRSNR